jgi:hypothetical protein
MYGHSSNWLKTNERKIGSRERRKEESLSRLERTVLVRASRGGQQAATHKDVLLPDEMGERNNQRGKSSAHAKFT